MKIQDIVSDRTTIDEDWKHKLAAGAAAALLSTSPSQNITHNAPATETKRDVKPLTKNPNEVFLLHYAKLEGLKGVELAQFMAQCAHETDDFSSLTEYGSEDRFRRLYDIEFNKPNATLLGNTDPGDGVKYIGRGYIQLTGKWNYTAAGKDLNLPLVSNPNLLSNNKEIAAKVSLWYWKTRVKPKVSDFSNVAQVTRTINRKLSGISDRTEKFKAYLNTLNDPTLKHTTK